MPPEPAFPPGDVPAPTRFESWRRTTATGVVLTAIAFGLREALEEPGDRPGIVQEHDEPLFREDEAVEVHLDWGRPEEGWAVVRPWLLGPGRGLDGGAGPGRPSGRGPGR